MLLTFLRDTPRPGLATQVSVTLAEEHDFAGGHQF
jgi:hypothetical protein